MSHGWPWSSDPVRKASGQGNRIWVGLRPPWLQRCTTAMRAWSHRQHERGNARNAVTSPALFDAQLMRETLRSERLRATILASVMAVMGGTRFLLARLD